jgi:hypothetical protein
LEKIGRDFNIEEMKKEDQKSRRNVYNLNTYARERDVIQDARIGGMVLLGERVLGINVNKSEQVSDWSGKLSENQIKYAAEDAAISLELFEKLDAMPDLTRRLSAEELSPGRKVDLVPQLGTGVAVASLNTRAATATLIGTQPCCCPEGIAPKHGHGRRVKPCANSYVVKVNTIYAPAFIIPGYKMKDTAEKVTLADVGEQQEIVVPIAMLRNHIDSDRIRPTPTPAESEESGNSGPSPPASEAPSRRVRNKLVDDEDDNDVGEDETDDGEEVDYDTFIAQEFNAHINGLSPNEISWLEAAVFQAEEAANGRTFLSCENLDDAPMPKHIKNYYSVVLGDIFHAMNRAKVPVNHEAKKAYFNALRNAFLIWNPKKVEELEGKMKEGGSTDEEIEGMKYFSPHIYDECIERHAPAPRILYYRVRAVFTLFGKMVDSKTKKTLFNAEAWKKANQVLKEILKGYYSDPPGVNLYSKKTRSDGTVMRNKYGMELIECFRGTNRVESYHKHLVPAVRSRCFGVKMADCLLAEKRHRHNQNISERRRAGFPKLGHFSSHKIDQLQELYVENHGCVLYPGWISASAYKPTDESFDTIALHHTQLHDALKARREELGDVALTKDLQYLCDAMDVPLPLIPFSREAPAEYQLFTSMVLSHEGPIDETKFAVEWCKHVDPTKNIQAKLPCHIRAEVANFEKRERIRDTMKKAKRGRDALNELHRKISPTILEKEEWSEAQADDSPTKAEIPTTQNNDPSRKRTAAAIGLIYPFHAPTLPRPFPAPLPQALHAAPYVQHGGMIIGCIPTPVSRPAKNSVCTLCSRNQGVNAATCPGRGSHKNCKYFHTNNTPKFLPLVMKPRKFKMCRRCMIIGCKGVGGHKYCTNK